MFEERYKKKLDVNMIPLINVIFLLLIFFMISGKVQKFDIFEVGLPLSKRSENSIPNKTTILLDKDGKMAVNEDFVSKADLETIINTVLLNNPGQNIDIKMDKDTSSDKLIWLINIVKNSGGKNINLITQIK